MYVERYWMEHPPSHILLEPGLFPEYAEKKRERKKVRKDKMKPIETRKELDEHVATVSSFSRATGAVPEDKLPEHIRKSLALDRVKRGHELAKDKELLEKK